MDDQRLAELLESQGATASEFEAADPDFRAALASLELLERIWPAGDRALASQDWGPLVASVFALPGCKSRRRIGRFDIERELGRGGGGIVFLAVDSHLERTVALKVPRPEVLASAELRERFVREGRLLASLNHPNIAPIYEAGSDGPIGYIVAAYFPVGDLGAWLHRRTTPADGRLAAQWALDVAKALQHAHGRGILHRDLKPSNIFLEEADAANEAVQPTLRARLGDFGLAKHESDDCELTATKAMLGTPAYMAPEQAAGHRDEIGPTTDIFALGAVLYELLTKTPAFRGVSDFDVRQQVIGHDPTPPSRLAAIPADLETICLKCLEKQSGKRYRSAELLADDLQRFLDGRPILARPLSAPEAFVRWTRRQPVFATTIGLGLATLALGFALVAAHSIQVSRLNRDLTTALATTENLQREADRQRQFALRGLYVHDVPFIDKLIHDGDHAAARARIDSYMGLGDRDADPREFAFRHLECRYRRMLKAERWPESPSNVGGMQLSPDGKTVACWADQPFVSLFDAQTGRKLAMLPIERFYHCSLAFCADSGKLAVAQNGRAIGDSKIAVFELRHRQQIARRAFPDRHVCSIAFFPDGVRLCLNTSQANFAGNIQIWNLTDNGIRNLAGQHALPTQPLVVAADGSSIIAAALDKVSRTRPDANEWRMIHGGNSSMIHAIALSPDRRSVAWSGADTKVRIFDLAADRLLGELQGHKEGVRSLCFSPDGKRLASAEENKVHVWNVAARQIVATFVDDGGVEAVQFAADGMTVLVGGRNGIVRWQPWRAPEDPTIELGEQIWTVAISPDGSRFAVGHDNRRGPPLARIYDMTTLRQLVECRGHVGTVSTCDFSPDGQRLATGSFDKTIRIWDVATGRQLSMAHAHAGRAVRKVCFARDGATIASSGYDGLVKIWNAADCKELTAIDGHRKRAVQALEFARSSSEIASAGDDGAAHVWDSRTGALIRTICKPSHCTFWSMAFAPNGDHIALGENADRIRIVDAHTGKEAASMLGRYAGVRALAYSPDGKTLAAACLDSTIRLFQPTTGRQLLALQGHGARVNALAFHPNGRLLISADHNGQVRFWSAQ